MLTIAVVILACLNLYFKVAYAAKICLSWISIVLVLPDVVEDIFIVASDKIL